MGLQHVRSGESETVSEHYTLIGQTAVPVEPCDPYTPEGIAGLLGWARWYEDADRIVKQENVLGICRVSTVFLGLDHSFFSGRHMEQQVAELAGRLGLAAQLVHRPILFETMAFWDGTGAEEQSRCATWLEAEAMHARMVAEVARPRAVLSYIGRFIGEQFEGARNDWRKLWRKRSFE